METNADDNEAPIYSLANYDGGGTLLQLYRSIVKSRQPAENKAAQAISQKFNSKSTNQYTTSGYQTNDEPPSATKRTANGTRRGPTNSANQTKRTLNVHRNGRKGASQQQQQQAAVGLSWWQLIESCDDGEKDLLADLYLVQILQLCSSLQKAIR